MISACLFDLDGTLLDRERSLERFLIGQHHRFQHLWEHVPQDEFMQRFIQLDQRGYIWKDRVYRTWVEEFRLNGVSWEELLADYVNCFREAVGMKAVWKRDPFWAKLVMADGVIDELGELLVWLDHSQNHEA
jgi:FMN phosphatase YigB (HAD superfamily)